jgi:hypothetical protein
MDNNGQELVKITTTTQLRSYLESIQSTVNADTMIAYAVSAQLRVLEMIQTVTLTSSVFDLFIEALHHAVQKANDEERIDIQRKAAVMVNSFFFFLEARTQMKIIELKKELEKIENEEIELCKNLIKQACGLLSESSAALLQKSIPGIKFVVNLFADLAEKTENGRGFFNDLIDFFFQSSWERSLERRSKEEKARKNLSALWPEFYDFMELSFEKLNRYKELFGKSIVLRELVARYKNKLIEHQKKRIVSPRKPPKMAPWIRIPEQPDKPRKPRQPQKKGVFDFSYRGRLKNWEEKCQALENDYETRCVEWEEECLEIEKAYEKEYPELKAKYEEKYRLYEEKINALNNYYSNLETAFSI